MRVLFGMILGAAATIGLAYLHDTLYAPTSSAPPAAAGETRPMVNWDVVNVKWHELSEGARHQWNRVTANVQADRAVRPAEPRG